MTWTLGSAIGQQTVSAAAAGLQGSPVAFTATATIGSASRLAIVTQPSSNASSGVPFAQQPVIQLQDASGNSVAEAGVIITVAIASGGGTLGGSSQATTDGSGRAAFAGLSITGSPGGRTLIFATASFSSVTSSTIQVGPGAPSGSQSSVSADPGSFEAGNGSSTIRVTVRDAQGTPVSGVTVVLSVSGGGNTITQPGTTNSDGVATGSFTSTEAGDKTVSATAGGVAIQQTATVTVTAPPPPPPPSSDASQTTADVPDGVVGSATNISVQARDATGAAIGTGGDQVAVAVSGANPGDLPVTDNGNGTYSASYTPQVAGIDQVAITLGGSPISGSPYSSTVSAPSTSATQLGFLIQPGNGREGEVLRPPVLVAVQDQFENVVITSTVLITVAIGEGGDDDEVDLGGTLTRASVNGVATFDDLLISQEGEYTLLASAPGLDGRESRGFRVRD